MTSVTLAEFLLARIAEDEAEARRAFSGQADPEDGWGQDGRAITPHVGVIHEDVQRDHVAKWHPVRVLAECEAKRQIVAIHDPLPNDPAPFCWNCDEESWPCKTMIALALPYADHLDYRDEWRA